MAESVYKVIELIGTRLMPVPSTSVAVTFCAVLGPRFTTVTVYPMVCPAVAFTALATFVTVRSALLATGTTTVLVFPGVGSAVVLVPPALLVTLPVDAVTVAFTTSVSVAPLARLVATAVALLPAYVTVPLPPVLLALIRLKPAPSTSVNVTFCATDGPRFTSVTEIGRAHV